MEGRVYGSAGVNSDRSTYLRRHIEFRDRSEAKQRKDGVPVPIVLSSIFIVVPRLDRKPTRFIIGFSGVAFSFA